MNIKNSGCVSVLGLVIRRENRHHFYPALRVYCPVSGLSGLQYLSTLSHKQHEFRKTGIKQKMCVLLFYTTLSEKFLIVRRIQRDKVHSFQVKYPLFSSDFNETRIALIKFRKILKYRIS
jgi:hypothetical protein